MAATEQPDGWAARQSRLERWAELSLDLLYAITAEGFLSELNPAWEDTFGWTREQLTSRPLSEFIHPADLDTTAAQLERINERHPLITSFENRFACANGSYRWLLWSATTDGLSWFGAAKDITARHEAEQRLRASEQQYRTLFARNPEPLFVIDKRTLSILAANDAATVQYGYTREELLAMTLLDLEAPAVRPGAVTGRRLRRKDGSVVEVELAGNDIDFDQRPARLVLTRERATASAGARD